MSRWIARLLCWALTPPKRKPDFVIGPDADDPYMERWWLIPRNRVFNIYLHHMRHDDDDRALHDHPWWSLSLCLDGLIKEHYYEESEMKDNPHLVTDWMEHIRFVMPGEWVLRSPRFAHRLSLPYDDAWTLFITGPVLRVWGFHCPGGWIPWKQFVNPKRPGEPGRGCGEQ